MEAFTIIVLFLTLVVQAEIDTNFQAMMYLYRFGYIGETDMAKIYEPDGQEAQDIMKEAITNFQDRFGLEISGTMNDETKEEMGLPRCGIQDINPLGRPNTAALRHKRYVLQGSRWRSARLTYRFNTFPTRASRKDQQNVRDEMDRAFKSWSSVSPLRFRNVPSARSQVDINIEFASGDHGDNNNFDGPSSRRGATLAHAFFPNRGIGGDVHFDDEENWVFNNSRGIDVYQVALHELGHSLGLAHSTVREAVMFPTYRYRPAFSLHQDDIQGIQQLYGPPSGLETTTESLPESGPADPGAPDLCRTSHVDAALRIPGQQGIYIFKESYCYLLSEQLGNVVAGYPRLITSEFRGMADVEEISAALAWPNGQVFLFVRDRVWSFRNKQLESGYPRNISQVFPGIPNDLTAAFVWPGDQATYFFKGDEYWRFDNTTTNQVRPFFPVPVDRWTGVSGPVDAVLDLSRVTTVFFQRDRHYRYSNTRFRVFPGFPRPTTTSLFGCSQDAGSKTEQEEQARLESVFTVPVASECDESEPADPDSTIQSRRRGKTTTSTSCKCQLCLPHFVVFVLLSTLSLSHVN